MGGSKSLGSVSDLCVASRSRRRRAIRAPPAACRFALALSYRISNSCSPAILAPRRSALSRAVPNMRGAAARVSFSHERRPDSTCSLPSSLPSLPSSTACSRRTASTARALVATSSSLAPAFSSGMPITRATAVSPAAECQAKRRRVSSASFGASALSDLRRTRASSSASYSSAASAVWRVAAGCRPLNSGKLHTSVRKATAPRVHWSSQLACACASCDATSARSDPRAAVRSCRASAAKTSSFSLSASAGPTPHTAPKRSAAFLQPCWCQKRRRASRRRRRCGCCSAITRFAALASSAHTASCF
mmetsp:Transcript_21549/g.71261  ORF Transcript_21549/g.71261 Transcript_21549/m.71261 type:complete len:305 (-) Transcript_21549:499-1413(-)